MIFFSLSIWKQTSFGQKQAENSAKWQPKGSQVSGCCGQSRFWFLSFTNYRMFSLHLSRELSYLKAFQFSYLTNQEQPLKVKLCRGFQKAGVSASLSSRCPEPTMHSWPSGGTVSHQSRVSNGFKEMPI